MPENLNEIQAFAAPQLPVPKAVDDQWLRDERTFFLKLPELLKTLRGKWVAIYNEQVVETGDTRREVLLRFVEKFPAAEVYIQLVDEKNPGVKMFSPRKGMRWL